MDSRKKTQYAIMVACLAAFMLALLLFPQLAANDAVIHIAIMVCLYCVLSLGLEIVLGFTGLFSLCHAAFYGMGAYTSALLAMRLGWSFWITMPIGAIFACLLGALVGFPALRVRGDYLAIATLGFGEIFRLVLINGGDFTRGPMGLPGIPNPTLFGNVMMDKKFFYFLVLILLFVVFLFVWHLPKTFFGRALMAIRDDEDAAGFMGINTTRYKVAAFAISGLFAGFAGAIYAHYITFISPDTFVYNDSITILTMVLIGGSGTVIGPLVGGVALTTLPELLRNLVQYRMLIYGLLVVIMMQIRPQGIVGGLHLRTRPLNNRAEAWLKQHHSQGGAG